MTVIPPSLPLVVTPVLVQPTPMRMRSAGGNKQGKEREERQQAHAQREGGSSSSRRKSQPGRADERRAGHVAGHGHGRSPCDRYVLTTIVLRMVTTACHPFV